MTDPEVIVVGSGPNGLTAAAVMARAGLEVLVVEAADHPGGGSRSGDPIGSGAVHDLCAAVHPMGAASPAFAGLTLADHGLEWVQPPVLAAHPLVGGRGAALHRSVELTAEGLASDGPSYRRHLGRLTDTWDSWAALTRRPLIEGLAPSVGRIRFGLISARSAAAVARDWFERESTRALWAGVAAHSFAPLSEPLTAGFGVSLICAGHRHGWPFARGGSQAIVDSLLSVIGKHGGRVQTSRRVDSLSDLAGARVVLLDTSAAGAERILSGRQPRGRRRAYRRVKPAPGVFKVDFTTSEPIPWSYPPAREAGTVHLGGTLEELMVSESSVNRGVMPERPFVLVAQASLFDPSRAAAGTHTVWSYAHVPHGWGGDATEAVTARIEEFAPGFRDTVTGWSSRDPAFLGGHNANMSGGDITGGSYRGLGAVRRPTWRAPYRTGVDGVYLCSASSPPGAGVHGMAGWNAAHLALLDLGMDTSAV